MERDFVKYVDKHISHSFFVFIVGIAIAGFSVIPIAKFCTDNTVLNVYYYFIVVVLAIAGVQGMKFFILQMWLTYLFFKAPVIKEKQFTGRFIKKWENVSNIEYGKVYNVTYYSIPCLNNYVLNIKEVEELKKICTVK